MNIEFRFNGRSKQIVLHPDMPEEKVLLAMLSERRYQSHVVSEDGSLTVRFTEVRNDAAAG